MDTHWWNEPLIDSVFAPSSVVVIKRLSLHNLSSPDQVLWKATTNGQFTVKSAYSLAQQQPGSEDFGSSSTAARLKGVWRKLWGLKVPGKVKHFLWRACQEALPTKFHLHKRHIIKEPHCVFCSQAEETTSHVLWACPFANSVWSLMGRQLQKCTISSEEFFLITSHIMTLLPKSELELWATTMWALWNARNKLAMENIEVGPEVIIDNSRRLLEDYRKATTLLATL
ncbi:putative ribonuclease h protein [Fagus crenata]